MRNVAGLLRFDQLQRLRIRRRATTPTRLGAMRKLVVRRGGRGGRLRLHQLQCRSLARRVRVRGLASADRAMHLFGDVIVLAHRMECRGRRWRNECRGLRRSGRTGCIVLRPHVARFSARLLFTLLVGRALLLACFSVRGLLVPRFAERRLLVPRLAARRLLVSCLAARRLLVSRFAARRPILSRLAACSPLVARVAPRALVALIPGRRPIFVLALVRRLAGCGIGVGQRLNLRFLAGHAFAWRTISPIGTFPALAAAATSATSAATPSTACAFAALGARGHCFAFRSMRLHPGLGILRFSRG